jgi:hypothetical protein
MTTILTRPETTVEAPETWPRPAPQHTAPKPRRRRERNRRSLGSAFALLSLLGLQAALALVPRYSASAFEDEGLYVFMGHRMLDHLQTGESLPEVPGSYFSGAPGLYPVLAALADSVGGLAAARGVSLAFAMLATVGTFGLGSRLYGRRAGLLAAAAFVVCGPVIYQSHLAVYDSTMMGLVAVAAWLGVRDAQQHRMLWTPLVGILLALAALVKYAGLVYLPVVAVLCAVVGWPTLRWVAVRRGAFLLVSAIVAFFFAVQIWGRDIVPGIEQTTLERSPISPSPASHLIWQVVQWVGPWLLLAVVGAVVRGRRQWLLSAVLLGAAVVGPLQQVRIGESTSLAKHVAFGMVFAAPLIGSLLAGLQRRGWRTVPAVALTLAILAQVGLPDSRAFLTSWVDERPLTATLERVVPTEAGRPILGERPSGQRYQLRDTTTPRHWNDTYYFAYNGFTGKRAYAAAIDDAYFGVIFLSIDTDYGAYVHNYLNYLSKQETYKLTAKVPRRFRGQVVGHWLVYTASGKPPVQGELPPIPAGGMR